MVQRAYQSIAHPEVARGGGARRLPPVLLLVERDAVPLDQELFRGIAVPMLLDLANDHLGGAVRRLRPWACILNVRPWDLTLAVEAVRMFSGRRLASVAVLDHYERSLIAELTGAGGFSVLPHKELEPGLFRGQLRAALDLSEPQAQRIVRGDITLDFVAGCVTVADADPTPLHPAEIAILALLMRSQGVVLSARALYEAHHGPQTFGDGCRARLEANIFRLRRALGARRFAISTVRGRGYVFVE